MLLFFGVDRSTILFLTVEEKINARNPCKLEGSGIFDVLDFCVLFLAFCFLKNFFHLLLAYDLIIGTKAKFFMKLIC